MGFGFWPGGVDLSFEKRHGVAMLRLERRK